MACITLLGIVGERRASSNESQMDEFSMAQLGSGANESSQREIKDTWSSCCARGWCVLARGAHWRKMGLGDCRKSSKDRRRSQKDRSEAVVLPRLDSAHADSSAWKLTPSELTPPPRPARGYELCVRS